MTYLGDFNQNQTVNHYFTTVNANGTPTALANGSLVAYKDGSNTPITANLTLTASFGGRAGWNLASANMSANVSVFASGSDIVMGLSAGDVAGTSIANHTLCSWSINNRAGSTTTQLAVIDSANTSAGTASTHAGNANTTATSMNSTLATVNTNAANANTSSTSLNTTLLGASFIESNLSLKGAIRLAVASTAGKLSGANTTTMNMTNFAGNVTVISATVDSNGNRTAMAYNTSY